MHSIESKPKTEFLLDCAQELSIEKMQREKWADMQSIFAAQSERDKNNETSQGVMTTLPDCSCGARLSDDTVFTWPAQWVEKQGSISLLILPPHTPRLPAHSSPRSISLRCSLVDMSHQLSSLVPQGAVKWLLFYQPSR